MKSAELEQELTPQLVKMGSPRIQSNTVLALDLSDLRKEYAQKMENLALVRDGSTGELHPGYWLCDVTAAEVHGSQIVPLYQKLFSVEAKDFSSENAEVLEAVDLIRAHTQGRALRHPLHRQAYGDRPAPPARQRGRGGGPVSAALSGAHH